ncbi:MAG: TlpA family protein disulfide reductase [Planctomycetaceae bacterium]|nr:TlpA family protein disulfide reductase [Planctomycetaceae bacterium]
MKHSSEQLSWAYRCLVMCVLSFAVALPGFVLRADADEKSDRGDLVKMISDPKSDLEEATKRLETAISESADQGSLQSLRRTLASRMMRDQKYAEAAVQLEKLLEFQLTVPDDINGMSMIGSTATTLASLYERTGSRDKSLPMLERVILVVEPALTKEDGDSRAGEAYGQLVSVRMQLLSSDDKTDAAFEEFAAARDRLQSVADTLPRSFENATTSVLRLQSTAASIAARMAPDRLAAIETEMEATLQKGLEKAPDSVQMLSTLASTRMATISRIYRDQPEEARELLNKTLDRLKEAADKDERVITSLTSRLKSLEPRIESAFLLKRMIGQAAPPIDIDVAVHGAPETVDALAGKVVLLDFWAVWCGPCIATFPHLKEWHHEYHDKGLEIVGVTRMYNYKWNEEAGRASRSPDKVSREDELAMLEKFMDSHELGHGTIVTPEGSVMQKEFGVTGIPHAVLIDRK